MGLWESLREGLKHTRERLAPLLPTTGMQLGPEMEQTLEEALLAADVGPDTAEKLVADVGARLRRKPAASPRQSLEQAVREMLQPLEQPLRPGPERPWVLFLLGVNGTGKTTLAGKLAAHFARSGRSVMLVAADTFRAAAVDQLEAWARRAGVDIVRQRAGADPAAVVHDALSAALARETEVVLVDTAGRLHTKHNLMAELQKMARVAGRRVPGAPHHSLLVLDATLGQNAMAQVTEFQRALPITSVAVNKLDGSARGGAVLAIADRLKLPISVIGIGEGLEDWGPLDAAAFASALLG